LLFCVSMNCDINGCFYQTGTLEDIFYLWKFVKITRI
jgi:hypothetical protein